MKRILIVCDGCPPSEHLFGECRAKADYVIAADGGADIVLQFNAKPDVVIGDMDSFKYTDSYSFKTIFDPDQETNDLEKALHHARRKEGTHIDILGATGRRVDQTLKNLSVLKQFDDQFEELRIKDNYGVIRILKSPFTERIAVGTQISLFPLSGKVSEITTTGLKYPLKNESLENGVRDGSSNEVVDNPVQITHGKGDLLLYVAHKFN